LKLIQINFWIFDKILSSFIILIISQNSFNFDIAVATATNEAIVVPGLWFLVLFLLTFPIFISVAAFSQHHCLLQRVFHHVGRYIIIHIAFNWIIMFMLNLKMLLLFIKWWFIDNMLDFFLIIQARNAFIVGMLTKTVLQYSLGVWNHFWASPSDHRYIVCFPGILIVYNLI
jgi:hypothetical protein